MLPNLFRTTMIVQLQLTLVHPPRQSLSSLNLSRIFLFEEYIPVDIESDASEPFCGNIMRLRIKNSQKPPAIPNAPWTHLDVENQPIR